MDNKIKKILAKMTLEDKISLCNGADFWHSKAMKKYGIPSFMMSDGPCGHRRCDLGHGTYPCGRKSHR